MLVRLLKKILRPDRASTDTTAAHLTPREPEGADYKKAGDDLLKAGNLSGAEEQYRHALARNPNDARSRFILGFTLREQGRVAEAVAELESALAIEPELVDAHYVMGLICQADGRTGPAIAHFRKVVDLDPDALFVYQNLSRACIESGQVATAKALVTQALARNPQSAELHLVEGNILDHECRFAEAVVSYDAAQKLAPQSPEARSNRGMTLTHLGRYDEALASFEEALRLQPDLGNAHFNEGLCRLLLGDFQVGWQKYEWRWKAVSFLAAQGALAGRTFSRPQWRGEESLEGKRILLHPEQGLGDTIQFCRYAEPLSKMGATVVLEVQPALKAVLTGLSGVSELLAVGQALPDHDFHSPLMSLPLACKTDLSTIPAVDGYLPRSAGFLERAERWKTRLGPKGLPRVGIVWSGSPFHKNDARRSIPFAAFSLLLSNRLQFHCLHNELRGEDRRDLAKHPEVLLFCEELVDFAETAALVAHMDLVICVDTSVAHLAGSMGKPVWILLPANPDWRWLLDRSDSPWYRSARLFRQSTLGEWDSVIEAVRSELDRFVA